MNWGRKLFRAPRTLYFLLVDRVLAPLYLIAHGVSLPSGLQVIGFPRIKTNRYNNISLGSGVKLFSRPTSNPLQLSAPCSFILLSPNARIEVGERTALSGVVICSVEHVKIGERVLIGANAIIFDTDFHPISPIARRIHPTQGATHKSIMVGNDVFIGARAIILKGTRLGDGCIVGAGAVVSGEFPPGSVIVGNPGRVIKSLDGEQL